MNNLWLAASLVGVYFALLFLPLGVIYFLRKRLADKRRSPLTQMLLRGPGESLRKELEDTNDDLLMNMVMLPMLPLLIYAFHISQSYFLDAKESALRTAIAILFGVGAVAYFTFITLKQLRQATQLRWL